MEDDGATKQALNKVRETEVWEVRRRYDWREGQSYMCSLVGTYYSYTHLKGTPAGNGLRRFFSLDLSPSHLASSESTLLLAPLFIIYLFDGLFDRVKLDGSMPQSRPSATYLKI
jgi:hypothetical protein